MKKLNSDDRFEGVNEASHRRGCHVQFVCRCNKADVAGRNWSSMAPYRSFDFLGATTDRENFASINRLSSRPAGDVPLFK